MYRLFYNEKVMGDILYVVLNSEAKPSRIEKKGAIAAIYQGDELIGLNFFEASKLAPLASAGIIYAPKDELIDALNKALVAVHLAPLAYTRDSGFRVAKIAALEEHPLDEKAQIVTLSLGEKKMTTVSWYTNLAVGAFVVVALDGTILRDGSVFHQFVSRNIPNEVSLMGAKELGLPESQGAYHPTGLVEGADFFLGAH
jgi:tRNA-binding EMAP/Myf-like protein